LICASLLPLLHQGEHFAAQVVRDLRVGIGQRLVLALHAAQLGGQRVEAGFLGGVAVVQWGGVGDGLGLREYWHQQQRYHQKSNPQTEERKHGAHTTCRRCRAHDQRSCATGREPLRTAGREPLRGAGGEPLRTAGREPLRAAGR
jgi:hypothetical protein